MTKRHLRVIEGGGDNRGGGSHDAAVRRVLCTECRFCIAGNACMVNANQRCVIHNPEGLCTKFESAPDVLVEDSRLILRILIILLLLVGVLCLALWLLFG